MTNTMRLQALFACLLFVALISTPSFAYEVEEETGSLLLTELDFEDTVNKENYLLVNFHALWCRYSKALKPEWKILSDKLKDPLLPVKLAKVEAYDEKKIAEQYGIEGFPTIKLFIGGTPHDYKGERNAAHIMEFVNRKLKNSLTVVTDKSAIENKLKEYEWVGVSIGDTDNDVVKDIASDMQDVLFVRISASAGKTLYSDTTSTKFVLVNNITGNHDNLQGDIASDKLVEFINNKKFPPVARISKGTVEKIFLSEEPVMLLVRREAGDDSAEKAFNEARKNADLKGIFMAIANTKEEVDNRLASNLGLEPSDLPAVVIVRADRERIRKYKLDKSISADSVVGFFADYKAKKAKRIYLSEPIPEKNEDLVKKVVTKSFKDMVLNAQKDVLLLVWAPWCGHCRAMMPVYDNVARKTREVDNFMVAKLDASVNDLEGFGLDIVEYPTILLFTTTGKDNPIEFKGERTEYVFDTFIRAHATVNLGRMKGPNPFSKNDL